VVRDSQRSKVYDAEEAVFASSPAPPEFKTLAECENYIARVTARDAWKSLVVDLERPLRLENGLRQKGAWTVPADHKIALPDLLRKRWIIVHELAHLAAAYRHERVFHEERGYYYFRSTSSRVAMHGPEYTGVMLHLVRAVFGGETYDALLAAYEERRVEVLPVAHSCGVCGRELSHDKRSSARFCSDGCRWLHHNRKRRSHLTLSGARRKNCEVCSSRFFPRRTDARYCSAKCKQRAYRGRLFA
jgi:predicted nucleic acid-binding Zn ribbon protein